MKTAKEILDSITGYALTETISIPQSWIIQAMEQYALQFAPSGEGEKMANEIADMIVANKDSMYLRMVVKVEIKNLIADIKRLREENLELRQQLEAGKAPESAWVSVEDGLPEEGGRYWCYIKELTDLGWSYFQWNCAYNEKEKRFSDSTLTKGENVTHWQPLPAPPIQTQTPPPDLKPGNKTLK